MTQLLNPVSEQSPDNAQHFVLEDASWSLYEQLLQAIGNRPIRITYDDGRLEIMSPLSEHDNCKKLIARMIEMLAFLRSMEIASYGSTTFKSRKKAKGLEPDESYYFRYEKKNGGASESICEMIRLRNLLWRSTSPVDPSRVNLFTRPLGFAELWRRDGQGLQCLHLVGGNFRNRKHRLIFPFLEPAQLKRFINLVPEKGENAAIQAFVAWVRENGWAS